MDCSRPSDPQAGSQRNQEDIQCYAEMRLISDCSVWYSFLFHLEIYIRCQCAYLFFIISFRFTAIFNFEILHWEAIDVMDMGIARMILSMVSRLG